MVAWIGAGILLPLALWGQSMNTAIDLATLTGAGRVTPDEVTSADGASPVALPVAMPVDPASPPATNAAPAAPAQPAVSPPSDDQDSMSESEFVLDNEPCAKVLYTEGNVWIRGPSDTAFHHLAEDEPIQLHSILFTGYNGTLDFAPGPGLAVRMIPGTAVTVDTLPSTEAPTPAAPEAAQVGLRKGTVFSALGRPDGQPIDFQVRTPQGVAGARGTMFSTTSNDGQAEVDMLHGTVQFETPDHQKSSITAGESQQVNVGSGGKFTLAQRRPMSAHSSSYFEHAGGLLDHASGAGVVRRSLGPDVARTLQQKGYKLPSHAAERFNHTPQVKAARPAPFHRPGTPRSSATTSTHGPERPASAPEKHEATPEDRSASSTAKHETTPEDRNASPTAKHETTPEDRNASPTAKHEATPEDRSTSSTTHKSASNAASDREAAAASERQRAAEARSERQARAANAKDANTHRSTRLRDRNSPGL